MKGFGRRDKQDQLEHLLMDGRPVPPQDLVDDVARTIEAFDIESAPRRTRGRIALVAVASVVMLGVFAAFGGVGLAASGVSGATASTIDTVVAIVKPERLEPAAAPSQGPAPSRNAGGGNRCGQNGPLSAANNQYCTPRVTICHHGKTMALPTHTAMHHLAVHPNDYLGPCRT